MNYHSSQKFVADLKTTLHSLHSLQTPKMILKRGFSLEFLVEWLVENVDNVENVERVECRVAFFSPRKSEKA